MKQAKCLPGYFKIPTVKESAKRNDLFFELKLGRINKARLFWYLCVIRNIAEKPGIAQLTNHFVEKGGVDPLVAYVLGHVMLSGLGGGHTSISDCCNYREGTIGSIPLAVPKKTAHFIVQLHTFLTTSTKKNISTLRDFSSWDCSGHTQGVHIDWDAKITSLDELLRFNPKTRTIKER
jgi:hypothetical protein